jgi:hypothetical protein
MNDDVAKAVSLSFRDYRYKGIVDPISGETLEPGSPIELEAYSGRWLRFEK